MVKKNSRHIISISKLDAQGLGVGELESVLTYVPCVLPSEKVFVHITKQMKDKAFAKLISVEKASSDRVDSPCSVFGKCGGCQLQHMNQASQLNYKLEKMNQALSSYALVYPKPSIVSGDEDYGYRNKFQFAIQKDKNGQIQIGLTAPRSQRVVDTHLCQIAHPVINRVLSAIRRCLNSESIPVFDAQAEEKGLAHVVIRVSHTGDQVLVVLVSNQQRVQYGDVFVSYLKGVPELKGLLHHTQSNPQWEVLSDQETVLWGEPVLEENINGVTYQVSSRSFFQANVHQLSTLLETVKSYLDPQKNETVWDLYCGVGFFSLAIAPFVNQVVGVEESVSAIHHAKHNQEINGLSDVQFLDGDVEHVLPQLSGDCDAVIVDPPRKGLSPRVIAEIIERKPKRLVYVSCNPETLGRDLKCFCEAGYAIQALTCLDMFPQTVHVETVVKLSL